MTNKADAVILEFLDFVKRERCRLASLSLNIYRDDVRNSNNIFTFAASKKIRLGEQLVR